MADAWFISHLVFVVVWSFFTLLLLYSALLLLLWLANAQTQPSSISDLSNKRILILTAHPDDEACFFGPTILTLNDRNLRNNIMLVSISTGDIDGKGEIRQKELRQSAQVLGLPSTAVKVVNNVKLGDGMCWDKHDILKELTNIIKEIPGSKPDIVITFDEGGATNHPNHKSLLSAAALLNFANIYALRTRKRVSLITAGEAIARALMVGGKQDIRGVQEVLFVSRLSQWRQTVRAANKHNSQKARRFSHRWVLMNFSVYQVANQLILISPAAEMRAPCRTEEC